MTEEKISPENMTEEQMQEFLAEAPTRQEVNQYMNNLFMSINNSFGMYQGYLVASLVRTLVEEFAKHKIELNGEELLTKFAQHNQSLIKEAQAQLAKNAEKAAEEIKAAPPEEQKTVNVEIF